MIDQATELREKMRLERETLAARRSRPSVVSLLGAAAGVGVTTLSRSLAKEIERQGHVTHYCGWEVVGEGKWEQHPESSFILVDAGSRCNEKLRDLWQSSSLVLLVMAADEASVMNAYKTIKLVHENRFDTELGSLVNMSRLVQLAQGAFVETAHRRLHDSAGRFLNSEVRSFGCIPPSIELESGWPQQTAPGAKPPESIGQLAKQVIERMRRRKQVADSHESQTETERTVADRMGDNLVLPYESASNQQEESHNF